MKYGRTAALLGALCLSVGLMTACSSSLSQSDVQDKLSQGMTDQLGGTYTVTCPSDIPISAGSTFTCDAVGDDGSMGIITVTQDDDQGNLTWEYAAAAS